MKKYLLLLLTTITYGQTYQNPTYGTVTTKTNTESATATKINVQETSGLINWLQPINIPIPTVPTNYTVATPTLGAHLTGIDNKLGTVTATTAGISTRVWFTADGVTVGGNPYYSTNATSKGTAASAIQAVTNDDNQKKYYTQDLIGAPFATATLFPPGTYAGNLSASTTPNSAQQRWTVELYKCDNSGTPIASGVAGASVGSLGVTVIVVLDSGLLTLADGNVTNVQVSGTLPAGGLSMAVGQRIRYHVSAEKVGTAASNITQSAYYGTSYNSFLDVPVPQNTSGVQNLSAVPGQTTTEALNALNTNKQAKTDALKSYSSNKKVVNNTKKAIFSFIWDDLQDSDLLVYNIFQEFGYVPNYAPTTDIFNSYTAPLYVDLYQKGCSILAHSVTHPDMSGTTLTNAQVNTQMVDSKKTIESYGIRVSGWVTPMSVLNPIYYPQIDKNFGYGFTNLGGSFNETVGQLRMSRVGLEDAMAGHNLANVKSIIDDAIANNKMVTFYGHHLPSTYLNPDTTPYLTETDLRDILTYLKTKTDENLCQVLSADEAVKVYYDYNPVVGTGVTDRLARWSSPNVLRESIISDDGSAATVNGFFRASGSYNSTYSPAFATASNSNMASVNNLFNTDGISSLLNFSTNKLNGVSASTYIGAISTAVDNQSIFVFGRKIDATNWKESFRVGYSGDFLINTTTDDLINKLQVNGGVTISDAPSGNSLRLNRGTGGVLFGNVLNADDLILYNKAGSITYQRWNNDGTVTLPSLAGTGTRQVVADASGNLSATDAAPTSGSYTPTLTAGVNMSGITFGGLATYIRVGNIVSVTVSVNVSATAINTDTRFDITLPINRSLSTGWEIGSGVIPSSVSSNNSYACRVFGLNTTSVRVSYTPSATGSSSGSVSFQYDITQ